MIQGRERIQASYSVAFTLRPTRNTGGFLRTYVGRGGATLHLQALRRPAESVMHPKYEEATLNNWQWGKRPCNERQFTVYY